MRKNINNYASVLKGLRKISQLSRATMPTTDILKTLGLRHNPFTDRTAEKTEIDPL